MVCKKFTDGTFSIYEKIIDFFACLCYHKFGKNRRMGASLAPKKGR